MKELWIPGPIYKWTCPECKTHDLVERDSLGLVPTCEKCGREMHMIQVEDKEPYEPTQKITNEKNHYNSDPPRWRKPTEKPRNRAAVWIIERHPKAIKPHSYAIHAGHVEHGPDGAYRVIQYDEAGCGSCFWLPEDPTGPAHSFETFVAWAYEEEVNLLPIWV